MQLPVLLKSIGNDNQGGTAIEYGLIASLVVIASMGALQSVADENTGLWATVKTRIEAVIGN